MNEFWANVIVAIHLGYMLYVVVGMAVILLGILLGWQWIRNPWFRMSHMAMILIVAFEAMIDFECPLTTWEHALRGGDGESETFIGSCLRFIMFPDVPEQYLSMIYYLFTLVVVASFLAAPPRFRRKPMADAASTS